MANAGIFEHAPLYWGICQSSTALFSPSLSQAATVDMEQSGHEAKQPEQLINQIEPRINH